MDTETTRYWLVEGENARATFDAFCAQREADMKAILAFKEKHGAIGSSSEAHACMPQVQKNAATAPSSVPQTAISQMVAVMGGSQSTACVN